MGHSAPWWSHRKLISTGVKNCWQTQDTRTGGGNYPQSAAKGCAHAGAKPMIEADRQSVQHAGAGNDHDDQAGQKKFNAHLVYPVGVRASGDIEWSKLKVFPHYCRQIEFWQRLYLLWSQFAAPWWLLDDQACHGKDRYIIRQAVNFYPQCAGLLFFSYKSTTHAAKFTTLNDWNQSEVQTRQK